MILYRSCLGFNGEPHGGPDGIFKINPNDGTILNHLDVGGAFALGFNPISQKLYFADGGGMINEVSPDGTGLLTVFNPGFGQIFGMAFTPSGDLALLDFGHNVGAPDPSQILLYDSSDDADNVFTAAPEDTDGDGIPDDEDACPYSDLSDTVVIDGWDSGVENVLLEDGCTISDLISECADEADNHGEFVSAVSHTTNSLKKEGIISGKDKGKIQKCAAKADIP